MKKNIKDRWTKALRSGRYEQHRGQLTGSTQGAPRFCCLGVLCDLHSAETGEKWNGNSYLLESNVLPEKVVTWAGLQPQHNTVQVHLRGGQSESTTLACLNDDGRSFKTIANIIEEEL